MTTSNKQFYRYGINVSDFNNKHWDYIRDLTKDELRELSVSVYHKRGYFECKHCKTIVNSRKDGFMSSLLICPNECNGVRHGNSYSTTLKGINDMATTHPHLVKYLVNENDKYRYCANSNQKVEVKCPECGFTKKIKLYSLASQGIGCPNCSDGYSYPEKFVANLLFELGVDYQKEFSLDGGKTRYDFYIEDKGVIIEVHGIHHYDGRFEKLNGRTLEGEQQNDNYKMDLALQNGIKNYIVLDARESTLDWLKAGIMNSKLPSLLNFKEDIDWVEIGRKSDKSLVKEVCDYYNLKGGSTREIGKVFKISKGTVSSYLTRGNAIGWCKFDEQTKKEAIRNTQISNAKRKAKRIMGVHIETGEEIVFDNIRLAAEWLHEGKIAKSKYTAYTELSKCCLGKKESLYGYKWKNIS